MEKNSFFHFVKNSQSEKNIVKNNFSKIFIEKIEIQSSLELRDSDLRDRLELRDETLLTEHFT